MLFLQTFLKVVNYQHLMPTRYTLDVDLKSLVTADVVDNSTKRIEVRKVRGFILATGLCAEHLHQCRESCRGKTLHSKVAAN